MCVVTSVSYDRRISALVKLHIFHLQIIGVKDDASRIYVPGIRIDLNALLDFLIFNPQLFVQADLDLTRKGTRYRVQPEHQIVA